MRATHLLFAASLVLLCSAVSLNQIRPDVHMRPDAPMRPDEHTSDTSDDEYTGPDDYISANGTRFTPNSTFSSLMTVQRPSWLLEITTDTVSAVNKTGGDAFGCPSGYSYLAFSDEQNNRQAVCNALSSWGTARLQGGGSADGSGYQCRSRSSDPRTLGQVICVKITFAKVTEATTDRCPAGYSTATINEAANNKDELCKYLGTWDIVRIGEQGTMDGPGYGCGSRDWDERDVGNALCVQRNLVDIKVLDGMKQENICASGQSLVTVEEAMANRQAYCKSLGTWAIARLAGGGSFDGPGYGCKIRREDMRPLGHGLCGAMNRKTQ